MLFIDANIVIEIILKRSEIEYCFSVLEKYEEIFISPITFHLVHYFCSKFTSIQLISEFLNGVKITSIDQFVCDRARAIIQDSDMDDALQIASCLDSGIDTVFTLDNKMKSRYANFVRFI